MKQIFILGAGGHARVVIDALQQHGRKVSGVLDLAYAGQTEVIMGVPVVGNLSYLERLEPRDAELYFGVGSNTERAWLLDHLSPRKFSFPVLTHPTAIVSPTVHIDEGSFVNARVIVNAMATVGKACILNTGSIIDHETQIGSFAHIAPGTAIAGRVKIGEYTFIGIGSSVIDQVSIGSHVIVGAGSTIVKNIPDKCKVVGVSKVVEHL